MSKSPCDTCGIFSENDYRTICRQCWKTGKETGDFYAYKTIDPTSAPWMTDDDGLNIVTHIPHPIHPQHRISKEGWCVITDASLPLKLRKANAALAARAPELLEENETIKKQLKAMVGNYYVSGCGWCSECSEYKECKRPEGALYRQVLKTLKGNTNEA